MNRVEQLINNLETGNLAKAQKLFRDVEKSGSDIEKFTLAEELRALGFLEQAARLLSQLLEKYPDEGDIIISLAETYVDLDKDDEALLLLEKIKRDHPGYLQSLLIQADLYQVQGLFEVSEEKLQEAEKLAPDEEVILFAQGELYASLGRFSEAIYKYEKVLKTTKEIGGVNIYQRLAECYSAMGEFEHALNFYEKALGDKVDVDILFGFGFTAYQAKKYELAIQRLTEVKELDPDYESCYLPLAKSLDQELEFEKAYQVALEGIEVNPFNKELYHFAGTMMLKLGKTDEAERLLKKALEIEPHYIAAILTLNKLYLDEERFGEVIELVEPLIQEGEEDPNLLWDYAVSCQGEELYSNALKAYRRAYRYFKNNEGFLQNYGFFLLEEGIYDECIEIFNKLHQLDPTNMEYVDILERLKGDFGS